MDTYDLDKYRFVEIIIPEVLKQKQRPEVTFQISLRACYMGIFSILPKIYRTGFFALHPVGLVLTNTDINTVNICSNLGKNLCRCNLTAERGLDEYSSGTAVSFLNVGVGVLTPRHSKCYGAKKFKDIGRIEIQVLTFRTDYAFIVFNCAELSALRPFSHRKTDRT